MHIAWPISEYLKSPFVYLFPLFRFLGWLSSLLERKNRDPVTEYTTGKLHLSFSLLGFSIWISQGFDQENGRFQK